MTIHAYQPTSADRRVSSALLPGMLALALSACADPATSDEPAAETPEPSQPAAQFAAPIGTAGVEAAVASAETKALFPEGLCDAVYEFRFFGAGGPGTPYMVQPNGEYHPTVAFDAPWGDTPTHAVAFRPLIDNKKVTHHYIFAAGNNMAWLDAWAPGNEDQPLPADVGQEMPTGKRALMLNMHYYNLQGTDAQPDRSGIAVCAVQGKNLRPKPAAVHGFGAVGFPMVPANKKGHVLSSTCKATVKEPVTLFAFGLHSHKLGRHMKFEVTKPDGRKVTFYDGPFSFEEQENRPVPGGGYVVENGDSFTLNCTYDNDTNRNVSFGENTDNEMCFNFVNYYPKGALNCGPFGAISSGAGLPGVFPGAPAAPAAPKAP